MIIFSSSSCGNFFRQPLSSFSMVGPTSSDYTPLYALLHLLTIKLSPTNCLLWKNQVFPILSYQNLVGYIDGTLPSLPETATIDGKTVPYPDYITWKEADQKFFLLLRLSLTKEALAEVMYWSILFSSTLDGIRSSLQPPLRGTNAYSSWYSFQSSERFVISHWIQSGILVSLRSTYGYRTPGCWHRLVSLVFMWPRSLFRNLFHGL